MIKVHYLKNLEVTAKQHNDKRLILVEVTGISKKERLGVPKLLPLNITQKDIHDGILELLFVILPTEKVKRKKLEWKVTNVYDFGDLPQGTKAIKVKAGENADIGMI